MSAATSSTTREPVVFTSEGARLFGVIHRPAHLTQPAPAVVIYHGFLGSKDQPHRMFVQIAEALAQNGIIALRFDLYGRGDSEGDSVDMTWDGDLQDAQVALDWLAAQPDVDSQRLAVLGMSWGGLLAGAVAGRNTDLYACVIWSAAPVECLLWSPQFITINGREVAENWGLLVGRQFYDTLSGFNPLEEGLKARCPFLLVYGTADDSVPAGDVVQFQAQIEQHGSGRCDVIAIEGADHIFFTWAWKQQVIAQTVEWLKDRLHHK
jgi:dienelactone hydrolase